MSTTEVITTSKIIKKVPSIVAGLPSILKGLSVGNIKNPKKVVGLGLCFEQSVERHAKNSAVVYEKRDITYEELNRWANQIAHYLLGTGIKKGDPVAIMLENRPELLAVVLACAKIGAVSAMINTVQRGNVLVHSINLVGSKLAVVGEECIEAYCDIREHVNIEDNKHYYLADTDTLKEQGEAPQRWRNLSREIAQSPQHNPIQSRDIYPKDPCFYIYTSGTTGLPKAAVFNHGRFMKAYGSFGFAATRLTSTDKMYVPLPFYHATALAVCWGTVLAGDATLIMTRKFSVSKFWNDVRQYEATAFGYVGELCRYLMEQPASAQDKINGIRVILGNGLRTSVWKGFKERFGIERVMEFYASSEGNIGFTNLLNFDHTVGFSPFPFAIVKFDKESETPIRDSKGRLQKVKKGEVGLLIGKITDKSPFDGYTDPEKTEKVTIRNAFRQGDAWFNTGDLMRDMGFKHVQFVDRTGDTFRWKGENVSTTEVEMAIDSLENVTETIVYGVEIPGTNGRAGMANIRLEHPIEAFDFKKVLSELKKSLPSYAIPVFIRISDGMETTGTFKHKKAPLKDEGFDLNKIDDPIFVWLPGSDTYQTLTSEIQKSIEIGEYRY